MPEFRRYNDFRGVTRRCLAFGALGFGLAPLLPRGAAAQSDNGMAADIARLAGGKPITPGRVKLTMPPLAENGNLVSLSVSVEGPMTETDYVSEIHVFSERNPIARVATFHLGPHAGRAWVQTNIRLATTQTVTAIARTSDGRLWSGTAEVLVTLAACVDAG